MNHLDFFVLINDNIEKFTQILLICIFIYYLSFRKTVGSIFDPLFIGLLASCFGSAVVLFLYSTNSIKERYLLSYLCTQGALYLGFFLFQYSRLGNRRRIKPEPEVRPMSIHRLKILFYSTAGINVIAQLFSYMVAGIPLFLDSRLEIYAVGGGFGLVNRLISISSPVSMYFALFFLIGKINNHSIEKSLAKLYFVILLVFGLLSGSRSFALAIVYICYLFLILNRKICKENIISIFTKHGHMTAAIVVTLAVLSIVIKNNFDVTSILGVIAERVISYGDAYFLAYPNGMIESIQGVGTTNFVLGDFLRTLRLVPSEFVQKSVGAEIYNTAYNTMDALTGPNPRHNILGYINWGFTGSNVFSFICGAILSYGRNLFYSATSASHVKKIIIILLYTSIVSIESDPAGWIAMLGNMFIFGSVLLIFGFFLCREKADSEPLASQKLMLEEGASQ